MRVTMLVRCLAMMRGGGETRHLAWARELTALGVDVEFIAGRPLLMGGPRYRTEEFRVTLVRSPYARDFVYRFQRRRGFGRLTMRALHLDEELFCRAAWQRIGGKTGRPDVVHAHALPQATRCRIAGIPVVINLPGEPHRRYVHDLRLADALVGDGWAANGLAGLLGRGVERIPKGVDANRFRPDGASVRAALGLSDKRVVLSVARLVPIKNVALVVDSVAALRARVHDLHLLVVGDGPLGQSLRQRVRALDLAGSVTFAGSVPHQDTPLYYRAADVFALSSDFDNSPNAVLEAMASGLPVVATDVGGVRELVTDPLGGAVVPPNDARSLADGLERYLSAPSRAHQAGAYNRMKAATDFSWRASAISLLDVYRRVIATRAVS